MTRSLPRTLLLVAAVFACGPKATEGTGDETSGTTAAEPTTTSDPSAPTQVSVTVPDTTDTTTTPTSPTTPTSVTDTDPDPPDSESDPTLPPDPSTTGGEGTTTTDPSGEDSELCTRVGGTAGVGELVTTFLGNVIVDDRINAYFLRNDLDLAGLGQCVVDQLGEAMGCAGVVYSCKSMLAAHEGLGISMADFADFAEDFVAAWGTHAQAHPELTADDLDAVVGVLGGMAPDIVEDAGDDLTVYQRVGRKPALEAVVGHPDEVGSFVDNVIKDPSISGFFAATDFERLNTCLTRQLIGIDGPNTYGLERDGLPPDVDPGASQAAPCRDMMSAHAELIDANDANGVETADFLALVTQLLVAMTDAGVSMDDQNIILGALGPLCPSIVTVDPENCP